MAAGTSWINMFGGPSPVAPANPSWLALSIAAPTSLAWPLETTGGAPVMASQIDVTAVGPNLTLALPPGETGSTGAQSMITNVGGVDVIVIDSFANPVTTIKPSQSWLITLIDNTTENGTWRAYQLAATTSNATAGALAGPGLQATGPLLQTTWTTQRVSVDTPLTVAQRATVMVWTGVNGTLQLAPAATLTAGWYCAVTNEGTGTVTVAPTGPDTINGVGTLVLNPGNSGIIVCTAGGFNSVGALTTTLPVSSGGTGATTASQARTNLGATSIGASIFTAPNASAINALLGIQNQVAVGDMKETCLPEALLGALLPGWHVADGSARPRTDPLWQATGAVNPAFWAYGNGDGATTYNLPDRRGRGAIGKDDMGGVAAGRVSAGISGVNALALGGAGGDQSLMGHGHGVIDPGHGHGVSDPGHAHGLNDPGHGHGVNDPTHSHSEQNVASAGTLGAFGPNANFSQNGAANTGNSATGITIQAGGTGQTVQAGGTAISIAGAVTGVTVQVAGAGGAQNMPPVLVENIVIFTGG